ncbi:MAG TPA: retropepsin-like aspartic protease [Chroococcidiopsis sp.]
MTARFGVSSLLLSGVLALGVTACGGDRLSGEAPSASPAGSATVSPAGSPVAANPSPAPAASAPASPAPAASAPARPDPYQRGIERASSAYTIGQSAQSRDDWRLVASRWQQAIDLMANVPSSSPNHSQAQRKLSEYRRNLTYAQRQANLPITQDAGSVVVVPPQSSQATSVASANPPGNSAGNGSGRLFRAPIVRRAGGTPVINVVFNGNRSFEMIVDTGASGTLITQPMAAALGVMPVGQARVDTASANSVSFPLGYVRSVQVDGAIAQNLLVAVAGPSLDVGLLGHDFFGNYDVTIRQDVVEFRER